MIKVFIIKDKFKFKKKKKKKKKNEVTLITYSKQERQLPKSKEPKTLHLRDHVAKVWATTLASLDTQRSDFCML